MNAELRAMIQTLRDRERAATPGPLRLESEFTDKFIVGTGDEMLVSGNLNGGLDGKTEDLELLVLARNVLPALLDAIEGADRREDELCVALLKACDLADGCANDRVTGVQSTTAAWRLLATQTATSPGDSDDHE